MSESLQRSSRPASSAPRYGVDAPDVMLTLLGIGIGAALAAWALVRYGRTLPFALAGALVAAVGVAPLTLGTMMVLYALVGKKRTRRWMFRQYPWRGDETVVDIGAGRGFLSVEAARHVPRGRVIAVDVWRKEDLSGNGPQALIENARIEGVAGCIDVRTNDARALDLPDASADVVVSLLCIHNIEPAADRERALREIVRVLRPGGVALIADYTGAKSYAQSLRGCGVEVEGPINGIGPALSLMWLVVVRKPPSFNACR